MLFCFLPSLLLLDSFTPPYGGSRGAPDYILHVILQRDSTPALQYAMPALHGRDQSPGVPRVTDGDGAILYRAGVCTRVLGWVPHQRRYVVFLSFRI